MSWSRGALCALALTAALAGCGSQKKPAGAPAGGGEAAGGAAAADATFTYVDHNQEMVGWDPATSYSNEVVAMNNMYEQLVRYDSVTKKVTPLLAESFEPSDGGKTWTFHLRQGVKFHTGRPVDAAAAKAAIERTKKLNQGAGYIWSAVKSIDTPDASTLVFKLDYAAPLDLIASAAYAAYIYDTKAAPAKKLHDWFEKGNEAGTGPYQLDQWNKGREIELRLKKFDGYWRGWDGPHYTRAVFRIVPEDTTATQLLQSGDATFVQRVRPQLHEQLAKTQGIKTSDTPSFQNLVGMLNTQSGPLKDKRVRQAVIAAFDYSGFISALKGAGAPAAGTVPAGLIGYDGSLVAKQDSARAKSLLAEAGFGPGKKKLTLTLTHADGDQDETLAASILKSNLAGLNIDLQVRPMTWETQWDKGKSESPANRQDIFVMYWYPDYADPFSWFTSLWKSAKPPYFNLSYLENKALDGQIDKLQELTATDKAAADAAYKTAQQTLLGDAASIFFEVQQYRRQFRDTLQGYVDNPAYANVVFIYDTKPGA